MPAPRSRLPTLLPGPRLPPRLPIDIDDHGPDLLVREEVFPLGHRGVPGRGFARQAGAAFRHAPEDEALRQLRDGAVVLEVRGQRIETRREMTQPVQVIAVTRQAVLIVDALAEGLMLFQRALVAQRIVEPREGDRLPAEGDL